MAANAEAELVASVKAEVALARAAPPQVGGGHIPDHGPAPSRGSAQPQQGNDGGPVAGAPVATKGTVHRIAISQAIPKPLTFIPKAIDGSVMTRGRNDARYHQDHVWEHGRFGGEIGRNHIYRSKAEAGTVSGSAAFTGASRHTTTTTLAIGCGIPTTSCCTTTQITRAGISPITLDSEPMPTSSISVQ